MGHLTTHVWDALFDSPNLVATLDVLPGYDYPEAARRALCQQYGLAEALLARMVKVYSAGRLFKFETREARDGWDLLLKYPALRQALDEEREAPRLDAGTLRERQARFSLSRAEIVNVLNAHAQAWARP